MSGHLMRQLGTARRPNPVTAVFEMVAKPRDRGFTNDDVPFQDSGPQLLQRKVRLVADQLLELVLMSFQGVLLMTPEIRRPNIAGSAPPSEEAGNRADAHLVV